MRIYHWDVYRPSAGAEDLLLLLGYMSLLSIALISRYSVAIVSHEMSQ